MRKNPVSKADIEALGKAYLEGADISRTPRGQDLARAQAERVNREFERLRRKLKIEFVERDPYDSFEAMARDIRQNKRMLVYTGASDTPLWDRETNWKARAVHDWDHYTHRVDFSLPGELAAYRVAAAKAPQLSPLYLSEIALQAASYQVLGGQFAEGAQKLVEAPPEIERLATRLRNPAGGAAVLREDVLLASTLLDFMPEAEVMAHLAAKGMGEDRAKLVVAAAMELPLVEAAAKKEAGAMRKNPAGDDDDRRTELLLDIDVFFDAWANGATLDVPWLDALANDTVVADKWKAIRDGSFSGDWQAVARNLEYHAEYATPEQIAKYISILDEWLGPPDEQARENPAQAKSARYTRLGDGTWGITGSPPTPAPGDRVRVLRRDRSHGVEIVDRVLKTSPRGTWTASFVATPRQPHAPDPSDAVVLEQRANPIGKLPNVGEYGDEESPEEREQAIAEEELSRAFSEVPSGGADWGERTWFVAGTGGHGNYADVGLFISSRGASENEYVLILRDLRDENAAYDKQYEELDSARGSDIDRLISVAEAKATEMFPRQNPAGYRDELAKARATFTAAFGPVVPADQRDFVNDHWHVGHGIYIADQNDGTFTIFRRTVKGDEIEDDLLDALDAANAEFLVVEARRWAKARWFKIVAGPHAGKVGFLDASPRTVYGGSYGFPIRFDDGLRTMSSDEVEEIGSSPTGEPMQENPRKAKAHDFQSAREEYDRLRRQLENLEERGRQRMDYTEFNAKWRVLEARKRELEAQMERLDPANKRRASELHPGERVIVSSASFVAPLVVGKIIDIDHDAGTVALAVDFALSPPGTKGPVVVPAGQISSRVDEAGRPIGDEPMQENPRRPATHRVPANETAVHELILYADNESAIYPQKKAVIANLQRKMAKGTYDASLAWKLWLYWIDAAAQRYRKEFGSGEVIFTPADREQAAKEVATREEALIRAGEYRRNPAGTVGHQHIQVITEALAKGPTDEEYVAGILRYQPPGTTVEIVRRKYEDVPRERVFIDGRQATARETDRILHSMSNVWNDYAWRNMPRENPAGAPFGLGSDPTHLIVSRHPAAIAFIRETDPRFANAVAIESATADDVRGKIVAGNVPLHLASHAAEVVAVEFDGAPPRGAEYGIAEMRAAGARLRSYRCMSAAEPLRPNPVGEHVHVTDSAGKAIKVVRVGDELYFYDEHTHELGRMHVDTLIGATMGVKSLHGHTLSEKTTEDIRAWLQRPKAPPVTPVAPPAAEPAQLSPKKKAVPATTKPAKDGHFVRITKDGATVAQSPVKDGPGAAREWMKAWMRSHIGKTDAKRAELVERRDGREHIRYAWERARVKWHPV